jgi:hypothetical protein
VLSSTRLSLVQLCHSADDTEYGGSNVSFVENNLAFFESDYRGDCCQRRTFVVSEGLPGLVSTIPHGRGDKERAAGPRSTRIVGLPRSHWDHLPSVRKGLKDRLGKSHPTLILINFSAELVQTGWFIESQATQVLVIFILRTRRNPFRSRPSRLLAAISIVVIAAAIALPFTRSRPMVRIHAASDRLASSHQRSSDRLPVVGASRLRRLFITGGHPPASPKPY